jgi:hypothetical protein
MPWQKLAQSPLLVPLSLGGINFQQVYLTTDRPGLLSSDRHRPWVIGPHHVLTTMAAILRVQLELRKLFTKLRVRLGDRSIDIPPTEPYLKSIPASPLKSNPTPGQPFNRERDHHQGVEDFWRRKTLESHHIVEDNIVKKLNQDRGALVRGNAPCVLLAGELHQRVFSAAMTRLNERDAFSPNLSGPVALKQLDALAEGLYVRAVTDRQPFQELRSLALLINREICGRMAG